MNLPKQLAAGYIFQKPVAMIFLYFLHIILKTNYLISCIKKSMLLQFSACVESLKYSYRHEK